MSRSAAGHRPQSATMSAEQDRSKTGRPDVANFGLLRPPFVYLFAILAAVALDFIRPLRFLPDELGTFIGVPIVVAALVLFLLSVRRFKATQAHDCHRAIRPVSMESESHLPSVLHPTARHCVLAQQPLGTRYTRGSLGTHDMGRNSERGALPRAQIRR